MAAYYWRETRNRGDWRLKPRLWAVGRKARLRGLLNSMRLGEDYTTDHTYPFYAHQAIEQPARLSVALVHSMRFRAEHPRLSELASLNWSPPGLKRPVPE